MTEPTNFLTLTNTGNKDKHGCNVLKLSYYKDRIFTDKIQCCSGAPGRQFFRTGDESWAGSLEPLPEGKWYVHDIEWADGKDNYSGNVWQSGIGPVTVPLDYLGPRGTDRSAIEIHIDWNWQWAPGTAGCVGIYSIVDFQLFVSWLRETDPRDLYVDWGLGTCPTPV
ncbi:MAG: hypothetical protein F6K48_14260 [Okeania sp. SIO3H1]|nr:hypothetical protein [Okeania sp. SIO3H1]